MVKDVDEMTENERKFLLSLIADGSKTDAEIAAEQGMSKSTANRIRRRFEESGTLREYIPIIDLEHIGIDVFATLIVECSEPLDKDAIAADPNVIFLGETDDFQETLVLFAGFAGFEEYHAFIDEFKEEYREQVERFENRMIPPDQVMKEDFTHVIKHMITASLEDDSDA